METINQVLDHYGLTLAECDDDWVAIVEEFRNVKSAMPSHIAVQREKEIAESFLDYHDVTEIAPENPAPEKKKPAASTGKTGKANQKVMKPFTFDEKAVMDKTDKMLEDM